MKKLAIILCLVGVAACNKKSDEAPSAPPAPANAVTVTEGTSTVVVAPGAVTVTQQGAGPAAKSVVVGGHAGGAVQVQVGGKKIEVGGPGGQVTISGLPAKAAGVQAPAANPAPAANGPCAQLAAKCPKCTLPMLKQTCNLAVSSGDPGSCQNGLNDRDIQANCK